MGLKEEKLYLDTVAQKNAAISRAIQEITEVWQGRVNPLRDKIRTVGCCHHFYSTRIEDRDDGYGKWWKVTVKTCSICGKSSVYESWPIDEKTNKTG